MNTIRKSVNCERLPVENCIHIYIYKESWLGLNILLFYLLVDSLNRFRDFEILQFNFTTYLFYDVINNLFFFSTYLFILLYKNGVFFVSAEKDSTG